jgi:hypothetical protein
MFALNPPGNVAFLDRTRGTSGPSTSSRKLLVLCEADFRNKATPATLFAVTLQ